MQEIDEIYREYNDFFISYAMKKFTFYDRSRAEDLVQDTFMRLMEYFRNNPEKKFIKGKGRAFVFQVMHHVAINNSRLKRERVKSVGSVDNEIIHTLTHDQHIGLDVDKIVKTLFACDQRGTELFLWNRHGYMYKELTKKYGMTMQAIKTSIFRLRKKAARVLVAASLVLLTSCNWICDCGDRLTIEQMDSIHTINVQRIEQLKEVYREQLAKERQVDSLMIDSLHREAMQEVDDYRLSSVDQIEQMRGDFLTWRQVVIDSLNARADSIQDLHFYDNMIIQGGNAEVYFDSTGKPALRMTE